MTGLDQEMMQKNISVKTIRDSPEEYHVLYHGADGREFSLSFPGRDTLPLCERNNIKVAPDDLFRPSH